jgi:RsmE family RNA methyltransferase
MNLILLSDSDFITPTRARLTDRRFVHIQEILKAEKGQALTVGKINGLMGQGEVVSQTSKAIELEVKLDTKPPEALPLTLILALPRPPMLKRILFSASMLGVKKIIILNFNRVEKSLWNSSSLKPQAMEEQLILGLEQAKDTVMPEIIIKKGFKPFVEDELPTLIKSKLALVAHPVSSTGPHRRIDRHSQLLAGHSSSFVILSPKGEESQPIVIVIGPEGGIIDYEIDLLKAAGCQLIDLGHRILRTDSVLPFMLGRFFK